jgi:glycosyltransferase 2 family protein
MNVQKSLVNCSKLLFTILLLFLVFKSVNLAKINLKAFQLKFLLPLLAICCIGQLLCSERWRIFAASLQMQGSYFSFVKMYFAGIFFNIGLPSLIGGDFVKAYILSRKSGRAFQIALASILQDRAAGLTSLLFYGFMAILINPISWKGFPLSAAYIIIGAAIAAALWLAASGKSLYDRFIISHRHTRGQKILKTIAEFHEALGMSRFKRGAILRITIYSFINSGLVLLTAQLVTVAAGRSVGIIPLAALFPLVTIATMLPVTLSGLGVRELIYVEALSLAGIPREQGLVISLATSALFLLCNLCGAPFLPGVSKELRSKNKSGVGSQESEFHDQHSSSNC